MQSKKSSKMSQEQVQPREEEVTDEDDGIFLTNEEGNYRSEPLGDESPETRKKFQKFQDDSD